MNKSNFPAISLIAAILSIGILFIPTNSINMYFIILFASFIIALVGIILGFIGKKAKKGMAIAGIIIGIISLLMAIIFTIGAFGIKSLKDCTDNGNGQSTCELMGQKIEVNTNLLSKDQFNKNNK